MSRARAGAVSAAWLLWRVFPDPLRRPAHAIVAFVRRARSQSTPLPPGPVPPLPPDALELPTHYGSFWFDGVDGKMVPWIRRHATWEEDVLRLLRGVVKPGAVVVDVGANVGFHTVALARLAGPNGRIHAFEPVPTTIELLRANLWRHGCANVHVHPDVVSDRIGTAFLELDPAGRSGTRLASAGIEVDSVTLDQALPGLCVDVLKIDVEGAEPMVLKGATKLLQASPHLLAVAEFRAERHLDGSLPDEVLALYQQLGFELCLLSSSGRLTPTTPGRIVAAASAVESLNIVLRRAPGDPGLAA